MSTPDYDVIAAEVHRKAMQNVTNEMGITLVRTSGSPIVTSSKDFSTCLMDTTPEHLAFASYVLFHVGSSLVGTQVDHGPGRRHDLRPGDGWIVNDPHSAGAMHQGDVSVIMPTFYERRAHRLELREHARRSTSAASASPATRPAPTTCGRRACASRRSGSSRTARSTQQWEHYIAANVRAPGEVLNDIRSMIAANNTASRKLTRSSTSTASSATASTARSTRTSPSRCMRERISKMPDGVYESADWQRVRTATTGPTSCSR